MLRQFKFQNLGLFTEDRSYRLKKPKESKEGLLALFVGENGSGKTSMFEFIRRCLSSEITKTESNKCDPEQAAFAKCDFDFEENSLEEMKSLIPLSEKIMIQKKLNSTGHIKEKLSVTFETIVQEAKKKEVVVCIVYKKGNTPVKYKLFHLAYHDQDKSQNLNHYQDHSREQDDSQSLDLTSEFQDNSQDQDNSPDQDNLQDHDDSQNQDNFLDQDHSKDQDQGSRSGSKSSTGILLLERTLDTEVKDFMITGEVTEVNELLKKVDDEKNALETVEKLIEKLDDMFDKHLDNITASQERHIEGFIKAIYAKLFGKEGRTSFLFAHRGIGPLDSSLSEKMSRGKQNYEDTVHKAELMEVKFRQLNDQKKQEYQELANQILGNNFFEFKGIDRNKVILNDTENQREVELLKAPEGVYEAHVIALLLTQAGENRYFTLCLDEPNKCMHPAQVERLREILLEKISKGGCSIICTTHSRDMISFDSWKHLYHFRRGDKKLTFTKVPMYFTTEDRKEIELFNICPRPFFPFRDVIFARRCLLVEGPHHHRFVHTLLQEWCKEHENRKCHLQSITIAELCGRENLWHLEEFCKLLKIPFLIWLDSCEEIRDKTHHDEESHRFLWRDDLKVTINKYLSMDSDYRLEERELLSITPNDLRNMVAEIVKKVQSPFQDAPDHILEWLLHVLEDDNNFIV